MLSDNIHASNHLGYRMLYLNPRIHLNEIKTAVFVQKLKRTGAAITNVDTGFDAGIADFSAQLLINTGCRRLFNNFLVTPLQRAVAITQVNGVALTVGKNLNLYVTRPLEELLDINHR